MASRKLFSLFGTIAIEGLSKTQKGLKAFDKEARQVSRTFNKLGRDMANTGKALTKGVTAPVTLLAGAITILNNQTAEYADTLLDLEQVTGLTTDNLQGLEAVALDAGVSFEGLTNVIAKFTSRLPQIAAGSGAASEAMEELGVNILDSEGNIRDMNELFPEVVKRLQNVDGITKRNTLSQQIFGKQLKDIAPVLSITNDRFDELFHGAENLAGFMDSDALNAANNYRVSIEELKREFNGLFRELSTSLIPLVSDTFIPIIKDQLIPLLSVLIDSLKSLVDWYNNLSKPVKDLAVALGVLAVAAGPIILLMAKFLPLIKSAVLLYKAWTAGQIALNAAMVANPIGLIVAGIAALVAGGYVLIKNWDMVKEKFLDVWEWMSEQPILSLFVAQIELYKKAGESLIDNWDSIKQSFINVWEWMNDNPAIRNMVLPIFALIDAGKWLIDNWSTIQSVWLDVWGEISQSPIIDTIISSFMSLINSGQWLLENIDTIGVRWKKVWLGIARMFDQITSNIQLQYNEVILGLINGIDQLGQFIPKVNDGISSMRSEIEGNIAAIESEQKQRAESHKETVDILNKEISAIQERTKTEKEARKAERAAAKAKREEDKKAAKEQAEAAKKAAAEAVEAAKKATAATAKQLTKNKSVAKKTKDLDAQTDREREAIEKAYSDRLAQLTLDRISLLELERDEAFRIAREKGASTLDIEEFYARKIGEARLQAAREASVKIEEDLKKRLFGEFRAQIQHTKGLKEQKKIAVENAQKFGDDELGIAKEYNDKIKQSRIDTAKAGISESVNVISAGIDAINNLWTASINQRMAEIEKGRIEDIEAIQASVASEEAKAKQIEEINTTAAAAKLDLQRENAKREKLQALFSIGLSTAMGIAAALTIPPPAGIILAGVVGALGVAQLGIAAATPIPFADGGLIKSDPGGGVFGQIGEGNQDELILPMKTGAEQLANIVFGKIKSAFSAPPQMSPAMAGAGQSEVHLHIGTLIADEFGLKKLEKTLKKYRVSEAQRTGSVR